MIRITNKQVPETSFVVSDNAYTAVGVHSGLTVETPWFGVGISYRRPGWIEEQETGSRVRVVDVMALWRLVLVAAVAFALTSRRRRDD